MTKFLTKISAIAATSAAISVAIALEPAQAITLNFNWTGDAGYSARGTFSYDQATAPTIISESNDGATNVLDSLTVSFFDPSDNLLQSYNTVAGGVSESPFFAFNFNTSNQTLFGAFNVGGGTGVIGEYFFTGTIGGTLELRQDVDQMGTSILLDTQTPGSITATQVPEPASILGLLALSSLGAGSVLKRKKA